MAGTIQTDNFTNSAGSGAPNFTYGLTCSASQIIQADTIENAAGTGPTAFPYGLIQVGNVSANDSAVVFTSASNRTQVCTPTAARTYTMPTTGILAGDMWTFVNTSTTAANVITIQSSGSNTIDFVLPKGKLILVALVNTPTTAANWSVITASSGATSYVPTYTGIGTYSAALTYYSRVGKYLNGQGYVTCGTVAGSLFSMTLPLIGASAASIAIDTNVIPATVSTGTASPTIGFATQNNATVPLLICTTTSAILIYCGANPGGSTTNTAQNGNGPFASGGSLSFFFSIPISGWGG